MYVIEFNTVLGQTIVAGNEQGLIGVWFHDQRHFGGIEASWIAKETALLRAAKQQLLAYFAGELQHFDLPLAAQGTAFQKRVWQVLQGIEYGVTCSYGDIAHKIHQPKAVRAVGAAVGKNPLSIIIPCHRVLGSQKQLTGYAGGLDRKRWLLALEQNTKLKTEPYQLKVKHV
ncbi:methylated-DNA--[protein]-cysteine S-methyltransferase [Thiolinea disciformis]|uniref:methylated-DNA--[protein]-cysteine S-methyltransferase n=1 Tax=Thiolinea disciformis TaxID=125614 RepID=UPI0003662FA1|nr:methylated-DNA--[protein]-cysteine S-methyltransferase [Thiolinea disciformis]